VAVGASLDPFLERRPVLRLARKMERVIFLLYALARSHATRGAAAELGSGARNHLNGAELDRRGAWLRMSRRG